VLTFVLSAMRPRAPFSAAALRGYAMKCSVIGGMKIVGGAVLGTYQWLTCKDLPIYPIVCICLGFLQQGRGAYYRALANKVDGGILPTAGTAYAQAS